MPEILFDNTETAFAYKSDKDLKRAQFLFSTMGFPLLVRLGTRLTPWAIHSGLPVKGMIKDTIFGQFVGGETLEETADVSKVLSKYGVGVILDYGVEGKDDEEHFDLATEQFIKVIRYAATQPHVPFMSIKVTGLARFALMEKMDSLSIPENGYKGLVVTDGLTPDEVAEWERIRARMLKICLVARELRIGVLIDAEDSWIQTTVDALTTQMMEQFNKGEVVVYNTVQLYRNDRLAFLTGSYDYAHAKGFLLGEKLVRGAYMEKERDRADELHYPSPIHPNKEATDRDYNLAVEFCIDHVDEIACIIASHNEESNLIATREMEKKGLPLNHPHIHFSQLYGMSDHITFNLAKAGCAVSKYLPFGPIGDVIPYLMRRAQENSSVAGQTGRELMLIRKELVRRKGK